MSTSFGDEPAFGHLPGRRLVLVHAHPDDETLTTGITMAKAVAEGVQVTLVTCTLGEQGEVIPAELKHLEGRDGAALAHHRAAELSAAMRAIGVHDHRVLGGGRWRDSGMAWLEPGIAGGLDAAHSQAAHPAAFARADLDEAAGLLADVLREVRPQVVVTYDPQGGYGHPDHVMAHRVTMRAVDLAEHDGTALGSTVPGWTVPAVHWVQVAQSWAEAERRAVLAAAAGGRLPSGLTAPAASDPFPPAVVPDDQLDVVVEAPRQLDAVVAALRCHVTQVRVDPPWFALSNDVARRLTAREGFRRVRGPRAATRGQVADDLFAGLDIYAPHD